jgi:hypothetical protein
MSSPTLQIINRDGAADIGLHYVNMHNLVIAKAWEVLSEIKSDRATLQTVSVSVRAGGRMRAHAIIYLRTEEPKGRWEAYNADGVMVDVYEIPLHYTP